jgi:hypothetical protein
MILKKLQQYKTIISYTGGEFMNGMDFVIKSALLQFGKTHTHALVENAKSIIRHSNP